MVIFNSYVKLPEGKSWDVYHQLVIRISLAHPQAGMSIG